MGEVGVWQVPYDSGKSEKWGELLPLIPVREGISGIELDLSALTFIDPLFLIRLRGFLDWHTARGQEIVVQRPRNRGVSNYLARMGVGDGLPESCQFDLGAVSASDQKTVLVPLTRLHSQTESDRLDEQVADLLAAQFTNGLAGLGAVFSNTIGELCDNATTHGKNEWGAYVAAQRYQKRRCVLAIGDLGIGIPAHLRQAHPEIMDDGQAIAEATKERVSGVVGEQAPHRGIGYSHVIDTMRATGLPSGLLRIWSGWGRFALSVSGGRQTMRRGWDSTDHTCGTWIRLELGSS
jgi:hypothetical protein